MSDATDRPTVALVRHALWPPKATVSTLGWERENRVIRHWNEACHLRSMDPET